MAYLYEACDQISDSCHQQLLRKMRTHQIPTSCLPTLLIFIHIEHAFCICPFLVAFFSATIDGRNLLSSSCLEKCEEKCSYTNVCLNVYKNQQNRQTGSRNLMGPKTLPTIWGTYVKLWTFFVIFFSATIDGRNLIFGHKLHIGTPYRGKRFWTYRIPTSCLLTLLIFIHIEHA
jgi:hypothetical protein